MAILKNYRYLGIKEVKTVFSVAFCKRDSLEKLFSLTQRVPAP